MISYVSCEFLANWKLHVRNVASALFWDDWLIDLVPADFPTTVYQYFPAFVACERGHPEASHHETLAAKAHPSDHGAQHVETTSLCGGELLVPLSQVLLKARAYEKEQQENTYYLTETWDRRHPITCHYSSRRMSNGCIGCARKGVPVVLLSYIKFNWVVVNLRSKHVHHLEVVDACKPTLSATKAMEEKTEWIHQGVREVVMHSVLCFFWLQSERSNCDMRSKRDCCLGPHKMMPLFTV